MPSLTRFTPGSLLHPCFIQQTDLPINNAMCLGFSPRIDRPEMWRMLCRFSIRSWKPLWKAGTCHPSGPHHKCHIFLLPAGHHPGFSDAHMSGESLPTSLPLSFYRLVPHFECVHSTRQDNLLQPPIHPEALMPRTGNRHSRCHSQAGPKIS